MSVTLTPAAAEQFIKRGAGKVIRVSIKTTGCSGLSYVLSFADEIGSNDHVFTEHGAKIVIDEDSLKYMQGTQIDFTQEGLASAFRFNNPNVASECGCGESFTVKKES